MISPNANVDNSIATAIENRTNGRISDSILGEILTDLHVGDIDEAKTFWANYGRTSYSAITNANDEGRPVCCKYAIDGRVYQLITNGALSGSNVHVFACIDKTDTPATAYFLSVNTSNTWSNSSVTLQDKLIGSGTGQNIKTVNNNNLIGSGNVSVGTVTSVSAGTGLSISGTASTTPTVNVASGYKLPTTTEWNAKAPLTSPALTGTPTAPTATSGTNTTQIATTAFVNNAISNIPKAMQFKGSLGTGGTITSLPTADSSNSGWTYKVITAGTYASQAAKVGDIFISTGLEWVLIPSGDEPSGTVTSVGISNGGGLSVSGSPITTSGTITIGHSNSVTAQNTQALYPIKIDAQGHISSYGSAVSVNNGALTIQKNGTNVATFSANQSGNSTANITVPTKVSELTNDSGYTTNTGTVTSIATGTGLSGGPITSSGTISHADTSSQSSVTNSGRTYIQSVGLDSMGHVTSLTSATETVTDTKNTAGSTDTSSKIYLIGATSQAANPQTYSDNEVFTTSGVLTTKSVQVGGGSATMQYDSTNKCIKFVFN